jgi:tetratricopeptide (TPR) repeat protein
VAFFDGNFTMARDAAIESLKLAGDSIIILNLLGKTFMRLSDHQSALKCFKKAQDLSPHNIERLCNIAEVQTELQDEKAAEDALDSAKALDPDNKIVKDAEVKIAIAKGDVTSAKTLVGEMESLSSLVAYMNNKAVAQAKCGFLDEAKETYSNTMTSIPDNQQEARLIVQYNLALTLVRASDFPDAKAALEEVLKVKKSKVWAKANSLLTRLKEAMDKGSELHLRQMSQPAPEAASSKDSSKNNSKEKNETTEGQSQLSTEEDNARLISMVEARKGDLCCYMIYNHPGGKDARTASLLAKAPRFQVRDAIEREESMGVERVNKSA